MINFIDTNNELKEFLHKFNTYDSIVYVAPTDYELHPCKDGVSFIYVQMGGEEWVLGFNHTDLTEFHLSEIHPQLVASKTKKWVFDKKGTLQRIEFQNLHDIDSYLYFKGGTLDYLSYFEPTYNRYKRFGYRGVKNSHLPIMNLVNNIREMIHDVGEIKSVPSYFTWYNEIVIPSLSALERGGLRVNKEIFLKVFPKVYNIKKHIHNNFVYTQYNPFTLTTRPSNHHGGVNYAALNKGDDTRKSFISRFGSSGKLIQFDFDAYHIRLLGDLMNYPLPDTSVHQYFADQYGCSYEDSKPRTFKNMYGGVSDVDKDIPFFNKLDGFIERVHELSREGKLTTPNGGIPIKWDSNGLKVFNYYMQGVETEQSIITIKDILNHLKGKKSKLVLYTYDSFLIDYTIEDGKELAGELKDIISKKWKVKITMGNDYSNM